MIRQCGGTDAAAILAIINAAAEAYRGVIPPDCWHEPYMPRSELEAAVASGIEFVGYEDGDRLIGVMGIQPLRNVDLIRHAYVLPMQQARGVGSALMSHLRQRSSRQILVGTWAAATWAIGFYRRNGFESLGGQAKDQLLRAFWTIPDRQIETSVVLAAPHVGAAEAQALITEFQA